MSSTNRGYDRHKSDYYITPQKPISHFLSEFEKDEKLASQDYNFKKNWKILDPCCGGDYYNEMSYPKVLNNHGFSYNNIDKIDIRNDSGADIVTNYLDWKPEKKYDLIITNPPFHLAQEFIQKALNEVNGGGYVIMLLRLNFVGGKKRELFWEKNMPYSIYAHNKRMSFTKGNGTDSIEYGHFIWKKNMMIREFSNFKILFN